MSHNAKHEKTELAGRNRAGQPHRLSRSHYRRTNTLRSQSWPPGQMFNLSSIAEALCRSIDGLVCYERIRNPDLIFSGQRLRIPNSNMIGTH